MSSRFPHHFSELLVTAALLTFSLGVLQALNSAGASGHSVSSPHTLQNAVEKAPQSRIQDTVSNLL